MANSLKGEVSFEADGESYTLVYSVNAIIVLEEKTGQPITRIGDFLGGENFSFASARTFFWAGLLEHHDISEREAGTLMSLLGVEQALTLATDSLKASLPGEGAKGGPRPRKPAPGIGSSS